MGLIVRARAYKYTNCSNESPNARNSNCSEVNYRGKDNDSTVKNNEAINYNDGDYVHPPLFLRENSIRKSE